MDAAAESMVRNLKEKTGRTFEAWLKLLAPQRSAKHGELVALLKSEHGVTHGYANLIALAARGGLEQPTETKAEEALFAGRKADMRPLYDRLKRAIEDLGKDVEVAPKKTYVAFRRKKQFALISPTTTRVDLGLNLKGVEPAGRLESSDGFNAMCSHRVRITSPKDVDAGLRALLRRAYDAAG